MFQVVVEVCVGAAPVVLVMVVIPFWLSVAALQILFSSHFFGNRNCIWNLADQLVVPSGRSTFRKNWM